MARRQRGGRHPARVRARLDRNESPFGTSAAVLAAWEKQRIADPRKYGINRYPDFFQTDIMDALVAKHGLSQANYTPLAGTGEGANVLAAALLQHGGEVVAPWPIADPISRPVRAWGGKVKRVPLASDHRQDLARVAAAVGPHTKLVHVQNPHDPSGTSFSSAELTALLDAVAGRNPDTYVWVDEFYAEYSTRSDFPDGFAVIGQDSQNSRLVVSRTLEGAAGVAGAPTAYLAASETLTVKTNGITKGFFVPNTYGWTNEEANVSRIGEKALLALLSADGDAHFASVRARNAAGRKRLAKLLSHHGLRPVASDGAWVLARAPARYRRGGLAPALRRRGVVVAAPRAWGARYRGFVRVSVGSDAELRALDRALRAVLGTRPRSRASAPKPAVVPAAAALGAAAVAARRRRIPPVNAGPSEAQIGRALTRRGFLTRAGLATAGVALASSGVARAFPPDSFYDDFNLARMIYHENPVGASPAALEAIRRALLAGPTAARRYEHDDDAELVAGILAYNRERSPRAVDRLDHRNVMCLDGSAEGLMLGPDTFVSGGTLVTEWPCYRIVRERVWQAGGTVVDVPLGKDWKPDYAALRKALADNPKAGLVHLNAQNNPMGTVLERKSFEAFASHVYRHHPKTVILVDESDREFMQPGYARRMPDFLAHVAAGRNLVHLQTFSHVFGLTGMRVGYAIAPRRLIERMAARRIARPVNVFSRVAAIATLKERRPQIARTYKTVEEGRNYLYSELDKLGLKYARSQGHYLMLDTGRSGTVIWTQLIAAGVLTRYGREWGLEGWLRVCPGLPDENRRFIGALREALANPDPGNVPPLPFPGDKLLPPAPPNREARRERRALGLSLQRRLARDSLLDERLAPLRAPYRATAAADLT